MRKVMLSVLVAMVAGVVLAGSFTDTDKAKNHGKTGLKNLTEEIDANFALVEGGSVKSATASVTNGQAVTLSSQVTVLTGIGGANDTTNTITIATPYTADRVYYITVDSASTNLIKIANDGTTMALSGDIVLDGTDTLTILTVATNKAVQLATSNN